MKKTAKTIFAYTVHKNDKTLVIDVRRESLPLHSKKRYRVYIDVQGVYDLGGTYRADQGDFNTAADCANFALTASAKFFANFEG